MRSVVRLVYAKQLARTHIVVSGWDAGRDVEVPVLDGASLLLSEQLGPVRDGDVLVCLVGNKVNLEAVEAG